MPSIQVYNRGLVSCCCAGATFELELRFCVTVARRRVALGPRNFCHRTVRIRIENVARVFFAGGDTEKENIKAPFYSRRTYIYEGENVFSV